MGDKDLSKVGVNAPVAFQVGLGQSVACDGATNANVVEFGFHGIQTGFDLAEAVSARQLSKGHAQELIEARELSDTVVAFVLQHAAIEIAFR
jgi:hypothetical protein